jgi:rhodanese-related sulfurtransferase
MKSQKKLTTLLLVLLAALTLIGSGRGAVVAQEPAATAAAQAVFDIKPVVEKYIANLPDGFSGIKPEDTLRALSSDARPFLLDVRETKELTDNGFIAGEVNIPLRTLTRNLDKLPAKDQPIIVFCAIGHRGAMAMMTLQLLGYTNVKSIFGGFNAWKAAGLPVVTTGMPEAPTAGKAPDVDPDLLAVLDKFITTVPDGFNAAAPTAVLKSLQDDPAPFLLDVQEPKELTDNGYIKNAVNVPIRKLFDNLDKLPQDKDAPIVTYCAVGHRGSLAMMALQLFGYSNVKSIGGGYNAWVKSGLPVVKPQA